MTVEPRVSVIIPTKDRGALLRRAVDSALRQTFTDLEVIIIDDASADDGARRLCEIDRRIRYVRHEVSKGECASRNAGIRIARAPYVAFLDDDDEWYLEKIERQVRVLDSAPADVGVVYTGVETRDSSGKITIERATVRGDITTTLFMARPGVPVNNISMLVRRECFEDVGLFDENLPYGAAWDMHVRLAKRWKFLPVEDPLVVIHHGPWGISQNADRVIAGRRYLLEKFKDDMQRYPYCRGAISFMIGLMELKRGNVAQARRDLLGALAAWPWHGRAAACLALTFLPQRARGFVLRRAADPS